MPTGCMDSDASQRVPSFPVISAFFPGRRLTVLVMLTALAAFFGATLGCRRSAPERPRVAVSVFAVHDLVKRVAGPDADVVLVREPGSSTHPAGTVGVSEARADLGVAVGLGFDPWMQDALSKEKPKARLVKIGDRVPTLGLADAAPRDGEDAAQAPHVWLDPQRAQLVVRAIAEELGRIDGPHALAYRARATELDAQLAALDKELEARTRALPKKTFVIAPDAFRYFAERYGLDLRAADGGASAVALDAFGGHEGTDTYEKLLRADVAALEARAR